MSFALVLKSEPVFLKTHCCKQMSEQVNMHFEEAQSVLLGSTDKRIYWSSIFNEYGLICQPSYEILKISFCPFCGSKLPNSKRDRWFERLEQTGWSTWGDPIPPELLRYDWE
jgi:hypothetical protein